MELSTLEPGLEIEGGKVIDCEYVHMYVFVRVHVCEWFLAFLLCNVAHPSKRATLSLLPPPVQLSTLKLLSQKPTSVVSKVKSGRAVWASVVAVRCTSYGPLEPKKLISAASSCGPLEPCLGCFRWGSSAQSV